MVRCDGPCSGVNVFLNVSSGDPDLFALENARPSIKSGQCRECKGFCYSTKAGGMEACNNITTTADTFVVVLYAYKSYETGTITFENVEDAKEDDGK